MEEEKVGRMPDPAEGGRKDLGTLDLTVLEEDGGLEVGGGLEEADGLEVWRRMDEVNKRRVGCSYLLEEPVEC
jgi:hypothetical protein